METYLVRMATHESTPLTTATNLQGVADHIIGTSSNDPLDGFYGEVFSKQS